MRIGTFTVSAIASALTIVACLATIVMLAYDRRDLALVAAVCAGVMGAVAGWLPARLRWGWRGSVLAGVVAGLLVLAVIGLWMVRDRFIAHLVIMLGLWLAWVPTAVTGFLARGRHSQGSAPLRRTWGAAEVMRRRLSVPVLVVLLLLVGPAAAPAAAERLLREPTCAPAAASCCGSWTSTGS